jgi:hypothetical protein
VKPIPFLASIVLVVVGILIRLRVVCERLRIPQRDHGIGVVRSTSVTCEARFRDH